MQRGPRLGTPTVGRLMKTHSKLLPALLLLILVVAFVVCAGGLVTKFSPKAAAASAAGGTCYGAAWRAYTVGLGF